ncbi:MAG: alanine racemase [Candidatus Puniceispirillaceae bacterium]
MSSSFGSTARLYIDKNAICHNWMTLDSLTAPTCRTGAVIKADAYGLGMAAIAPALYDAGCRLFFTARLHEATSLHQVLAQHNITNAEIIVFDGIYEGQQETFHNYDLTACLNDLGQIKIASAMKQQFGKKPKVAIHIDTAMARLGLSLTDWRALQKRHDWQEELDITLTISHLASSDDPRSPQNEQQRQLFEQACENMSSPLSLANTGGIVLGKPFHFDVTRPGLALYGLSPVDDNFGLQTALTLEADILQIRDLKKGDTIGYGASFIAPAPMRVATIGIGYADGLLRRYKDHIRPRINGVSCPLVGRISMDSCVADISALPQDIPNPEKAILFDTHFTPKELAQKSDTIAYEIITTLGERVVRLYDGS